MVVKSMLGWPTGRRGARQWRRMLSDASELAANDVQLLRRAWQALAPAAPETVAS